MPNLISKVFVASLEADFKFYVKLNDKIYDLTSLIALAHRDRADIISLGIGNVQLPGMSGSTICSVYIGVAENTEFGQLLVKEYLEEEKQRNQNNQNNEVISNG